jgi:hypothetical protein
VVALAALFLALLAGAALETGLPRSRGRKNAMWNKNISDKRNTASIRLDALAAAATKIPYDQDFRAALDGTR